MEIKLKDSSSGNGKHKHKDKNKEDKKDKEDFREPKENIRTKEQCKRFVTKDSHIRFDFAKSNTCVNYIKFKSKKTTETTIATIEELKEKSLMASTEPKDEVYKNFNIRIKDGTFADPNNLENAIIGFKVNKAWITENQITADSIILQHYSGGIWSSLPTKKVDEDKSYIYFEAETPSFSPFAISAKNNIIAIEGPEETGSSESKTSNKPGSDIGSNMDSQEKKNQGVPRSVSLLAGFLIVILIGAFVVKKMGPKK